ncbi:MAG: YicC/YloC family endoribonuclease [Christensenellales bacterium]
MANSMTGFGRAVSSRDGRELTVELKSVNHRFLDISVRLPRSVSFVEDAIRKVLAEKLSRGHVDVFVNYKNTRSDARTVSVDKNLLLAYLRAGEEAAEATGLPWDMTLSTALRHPDVLTVTEAEEDQQSLVEMAAEAASAAADELVRMRQEEGGRLCADLSKRGESLKALIARIAERAPLVVADYQKRLHERIAELLGDASVDESRLAMEVALFADRASITEELVRLTSHLDQMEQMLSSKEATGRKLDFLVQEMNREINTIGSKASDLEIANLVIAGKAEIEKIREQVQNIE